MSDRNAPVGVFDSGVGGLTVAREIMRQLPDERIVYFGDTARVPYGSKSRDTILRYSRQIIRFLRTKEVKAIVIACNTATALTLDTVAAESDIPIIRPLYRCLKGEKILEITGILNGTTNFILTKMDKEGASFEAVLKEAQDLGYAERNPEADVEGYDTCRKIAILTAMASGKEVNYEDISTEGITKITDVDFKYADKLGTSVKLFGTSRLDGDEVHAWVAPVMIGKDHPLYAVNDVFNGIMVKGNMLGTAMFYGSGAGKLPTASAVVADIMEAVENADHNVPLGWSSERLVIADQKTSVHRYFVRVEGTGSELEQAAAAAFGGAELVKLDSLNDEFALLTGEMSEAAYAECAAAFEKTAKIRQRIRAEF